MDDYLGLNNTAVIDKREERKKIDIVPVLGVPVITSVVLILLLTRPVVFVAIF